MKLRNLRIGISNVNTTTTRKDFEVVETNTNRVRSADGSMSKEIDSYSIHCAAYKGDILKVKVPKELANKVTALSSSLANDVTVTATFQNLKLRAYAMKTGDGSLISGVSATADDFDFSVADETDFSDIEL